MSIFFGPKLVIYLDSQAIRVYQSGQDTPLGINFSPDSIASQEILDAAAFKAQLSKFVTTNQDLLKGQKTVIALSDDLIYQKTLPVVKDVDLSVSAKGFFDSIPFDPQKISKMSLPVSDKLYLFATNKELYESLINILEPIKTEVVAVVPLTVLGGVGAGGKLNRDEVDSILGNGDLLKNSNFLAPLDTENLLPTLTDIEKPQMTIKSTDVIEGEEGEEEGEGKKGWLIFGGILLILIGIGVSLVALKIVKLPFNIGASPIPVENQVITPTTIPPTPTLEASGSATASATPSAVTKDKLKVNILNGSGISGQAGKVRDQLKNLGYLDFNLGNASDSTHTKTEVSVSSKMEKSLVDELVKSLEGILSVVEVQKEKIVNYDISIITGSDK